MKAEIPAELRILRMKEVQVRVGFGRSTIYELVNPRSRRFDPEFPTPIRLGQASVGWLESEINRWIQSRVVARDIAVARSVGH